MKILPKLKFFHGLGGLFRILNIFGSWSITRKLAATVAILVYSSILVKEGGEYLLVVLPSDYYVDLESLHTLLDKEVEMADEAELADLLPDCELGAIPATGHVYGIKTLWDPNTSLGREEHIYFEAGDHEHLIKVSGKQFHELMANAGRGEFSHHF